MSAPLAARFRLHERTAPERRLVGVVAFLILSMIASTVITFFVHAI